MRWICKECGEIHSEEQARDNMGKCWECGGELEIHSFVKDDITEVK